MGVEWEGGKASRQGKKGRCIGDSYERDGRWYRRGEIKESCSGGGGGRETGGREENVPRRVLRSSTLPDNQLTY